MVSKPIVVTAKAPKVAETTPVIVAMEPKAKADKAPTESTSKYVNAIIAHTTSSRPTPINFAPPEVVTKIEEKEMIGLAMDSFTEKQKAENEKLRCTMQQAIATQFSSLGESLILNLLLA